MDAQPIILMYHQQMVRLEEHTSSSKTLSKKKKKSEGEALPGCWLLPRGGGGNDKGK